MQEQILKTTLLDQLKNKSTDSPTYRKALTIYESILQSARDIPNFDQNYANSNSNLALFVTGSVFKLLAKDQQSMKFNVDSMLLLINLTLPSANISTVKNSGILKELQRKVYSLIVNSKKEERTPIMIRLAISVLSYTLINTDNIKEDKEVAKILCTMFNNAIEQHQTDSLSKQSSRMLTHLVKNNSNVATVLSQRVNMTLLANQDSTLYLNNVREVIAQFPLKLINDIGYRVCKHLNNIECISEKEEVYLAQTYFFLEKLAAKFSVSTLEEIAKELISNIPSSAQSESKVLFCYLQALHAIFEAFLVMKQKAANNYISSVISILQEFITKGGRIEKQATGILRHILTNCIRKSLWVSQNQEQDIFGLQKMGLDEEKGNNFQKVVIMLEGMLSDQYPNHKSTSLIIAGFFSSLDKSAASSVICLIDKIVNFRDKFQDKAFNRLMHAIFGAIGISSLLQVYRVGIDGDISNEEFESKNNLWLIKCTQKYDGEQDFQVYMTYYYPLLLQLKTIISNPAITSIRSQAYKSLIEMMWRCLKVFCRQPKDTYNYDSIIDTIKNEVPIASDSTLDHIAMALENLCSALHKKQYECKWAGNLISLLAKNLNLQKSNAKQLLRAIKYLSAIADKEYLNKVFDKNIVKLVQQKQKNTLTHPDNLANNMKNLEILIAVSNGINFRDPTVVAPYKVCRQQLVVKLISLLIQENSLFQKKSYKYIFETLGSMPSSYLNEVVDLLEAHQHKVNAASKHYRLAILMYMWRILSANEETISEALQFLKKYLPQILMDMRESNQRTRKQAIALFESFCEKMIEIESMQKFVEVMCAGLAVDSTETKVSTLSGLAQIYQKQYELPIDFSLGILEIALMMLYQQKTQIYKATVDFSRRFIFSFDKNNKQGPQILSTILDQLFKADQNSKLDNRSILKHFLLKLTKRFGRELTEKMIPADDRKILSNAIKLQNREKKKKKEKQIRRRLQAEKARMDREQSSDSQYEENNINENEGAGQMQMEQELKELDNTDNLLLKYDLQQENFHFQQDKLQSKQTRKSERERREDEITFENGMMVVRDEVLRNRDRRNDNQEDKQEEDTEARQYLNIKKKRKLNDIHEVKQSGASFKASRAGGDIQHKDKPQPYAFIQFNSKALNKRFKKRAEKAFDTIFERHQGGLKGIKSKIANRGH